MQVSDLMMEKFGRSKKWSGNSSYKESRSDLRKVSLKLSRKDNNFSVVSCAHAVCVETTGK